MRRKWLFTCMTALLFAHTSCVTDATIMEVETSSVESRNFTTEREVLELVQQARFGKDEAYKSLAFCYRDGKGIEESNLNAIFMYLVYCQKTGQDLKTSIELFEEGSPYRLLIEILSSPILDKETEKKIVQLQQLAPADAKSIMAMINLCKNDKDNNVLKFLQEAESEGSELARALQVFYYEEKKDTTMYLRCLIRAAEKHPFLYPKIAKIYEERYGRNEDFTNIQKAIECYYKADSYGMLAPRQANNLWSIYDYFSQKGLLDYDEIEVERLKKIIETN